MKKKKKFIKINLYLIGDLFFLLSIFLFLDKDKNMKYTLYLLLITIIIYLIQAYYGCTKVKNNYKKEIYAKSEDDEKVFIIKQSEKKYNIDGIKYDNKVYKICDGTHIILTKKGKIINLSLFGFLINFVRGGELNKCPDENWQEIFDI